MRLVLLLILLGVFGVFRVDAAASCDADAQVADDFLNLRESPTTESRVLALLDPLTELMILRRTEANDWLYARAPDGLYGWVSADFTQVFVDLSIVPTDSESNILPPGVAAHVREIFEATSPPSPAATSVGRPQTEREEAEETPPPSPLPINGEEEQEHKNPHSESQHDNNIANVFSKVGDSITVARHFLQPVGEGIYDLGDYGELQTTIDYFDADSFTRISMAAGVGWTTAAVLSPRFADPERCEEGETPLECEYRRARPAIALIMFGTNDVSHLEAATYCANLRKIAQISIENGVIPVLSTIPNRVGKEEKVAEFNRIVVAVAREYAVPLWDYGAAMRDLPDGGLDIDGTHPSIPPAGYRGSADFRADNLYYGYVIRNLTALQMLDAVRDAVVGGG